MSSRKARKDKATNTLWEVRRAVSALLPNPYYGSEHTENKTLRQIQESIKVQTDILTDLSSIPAVTSFPTETYTLKVLNIQKRRYATRGSGVNIYPRSGPARGLIKIIREFYSFERLATEKYAPNSGRNLISYEVKRWMPPGKWDGQHIGGTCRWCRQPTENIRKFWHKDCIAWYLTATGSVKPPDGRVHKGPLWENTEWEEYEDWEGKKRRRKVTLCCECKTEPYSEIDHIKALSIAWELRKRGDRRWWRAWTPGNLRPLCHECHNLKTREDRGELSRLQKGQLKLI